MKNPGQQSVYAFVPGLLAIVGEVQLGESVFSFGQQGV